MSLTEKFAELVAGVENAGHKLKLWCEHAADTGYGSELPPAVSGALVLLATEIDKLKAGGVAPIDPAAIEAAVADKVKAVIGPFLKELEQAFAARLAEIEGAIAKLQPPAAAPAAEPAAPPQAEPAPAAAPEPAPASA